MLRVGCGENPSTRIAIAIELLASGRELLLAATDEERAVVVLAGTCALQLPDGDFAVSSLGRRQTVFDGPAAAAYVPRRQSCHIHAVGEHAQVAVVSAPARTDRAPYV